MSTLAKDFAIKAIIADHWIDQTVTVTWNSDMPLEFRIHMLRVVRDDIAGDDEEYTDYTSVSRDLLTEVLGGPTREYVGPGEVQARRIVVRNEAIGVQLDTVHIRILDDGAVSILSLPTAPLADLVNTSLHKVPQAQESEALDVDGLITEIFHHAEEADQ